MTDLEKIRRKVELAQASLRAAMSDVQSAQSALDDALAELRKAVESDQREKK